MNVLIVDDEQHAREAVKLLVDWSRYEIDAIIEADNGEEAKRVITAVRPELVLTDMHMPISDGKELLEWIGAHYPEVQIIVISGYSDFEYMRHTVKYGGSDYLLKPLDPEQLNEAVRKCVETIEDNRQNRLKLSIASMERNQYKPVYWDKMFSQLLNDSSLYGSMQEQLQAEFGCPPPGTACRAIVCSLEFAPSAVIRRFRGDRDLLTFAVTNVMNDFVLLQWKAGYAFRHFRHPDAVIVLLWDGLDLLGGRLELIEQALEATVKSRLPIGIGTIRPFPDGLGESAGEALSALQERNLLDVKPYLHWYARSSETTGTTLSRLSEIEESLRLAILTRKRDEIAAVLRQWMDTIRTLPAVTPNQVRMWEQDFQMIRSKWQQIYFSGELPDTGLLRDGHLPFPVIFDIEGRLSPQDTEHALLTLAAELSETLSYRQRQERSIVAEIERYIAQHIDEDLSLQALASKFYLSREYISRRFKLESGSTLSEYVERLRIDKAKLLLGNPQLKITEVAAMVGYPDEKYFSKVFKKQTGYPPIRYRKGL
jgi:two-component system response regulator YesN